MKSIIINRLPKPRIENRPVNLAIFNHLKAQGLPDWLSRALAARLDNPILLENLYADDLAIIPDPSSIPDMDKAVDRIVDAIENKERIVFACDHDMDGTGSAAVLWTAFTNFFGVHPELLHVVTSHRLTEGYGITMPVAERIIAINPSLVISADKGSADEDRIKIITEAGIQVIVTDHHEIGAEGPPQSAYAVVNPIRQDSPYDKHICGAGVAFLTMAKVRTALIQRKLRENIPSLVSLLDYVAVATIADCVSMAPTKSIANRTFVKRGLQLINKQTKPCWQALCQELQGPVNAETIGFKLAPAVAAAGRLDWAEAGFRFLIADTRQEADTYWEILQQENAQRKAIEKNLTEKAINNARNKNTQSLVLYFQDGHSGVHGITASRLVEAFGKPAGIFSPKGAGLKSTISDTSTKIASGSFRGVAGFHVRDALAHVDKNHPGLLLGFGGHQGAAGCSILTESFDLFASAYEKAVNAQLGDTLLKPTIWVDGTSPTAFTENNTASTNPATNKTQAPSDSQILDELEKLEPWGRGFEYPTFTGTFEINSIQPLGDGSHLKLTLWDGVSLKEAIWFNATQHIDTDNALCSGSSYSFVYALKSNWYKNKKKVQLQIICMTDSV